MEVREDTRAPGVVEKMIRGKTGVADPTFKGMRNFDEDKEEILLPGVIFV